MMDNRIPYEGNLVASKDRGSITNDAASYPGRTESSATPLRKHQKPEQDILTLCPLSKVLRHHVFVR
jgi:hypothetical protein